MAGGALSVNLLWFLFDGYILSGFLKKSIEIKSNAFQTKIKIHFGDLFKQKGWKVIGVNDFFDSLVDESHISAKSLHGQMLQKYWGVNRSDWDSQVSSSLAETEPVETVERVTGKNERYAVGTVATVQSNDQKFLCVALSKTCIDTKVTEANSLDFHLAIREILMKARSICSGDTIIFPAIGSGLSRTGINLNVLINMILLAIFEESKKLNITSEIRIVLPKEKKKEVDLMGLLRSWK